MQMNNVGKNVISRSGSLCNTLHGQELSTFKKGMRAGLVWLACNEGGGGGVWIVVARVEIGEVGGEDYKAWKATMSQSSVHGNPLKSLRQKSDMVVSIFDDHFNGKLNCEEA